ncbi:MAG TPA: hypothetical protein GX497_12785 [Bacillus bacterium]|nr:hypothetical protein [Bacillus sp. (in: firmicutes)]
MNEVAGTIRVVHVNSAEACNTWLEENGDAEVVDIKFSTCESETDILIIYRIEYWIEVINRD